MLTSFCASITALLLLTVALAPVQAQDCDPSMTANLTVQSSLSPSLPGQSVTFTAFVEAAGDGPDPTGAIQLMDGDTDLGTLPIKLGQVSTTATFYQAGAHSIYASYSGDLSYCAAFVRFGQPVNRFVTTIAVTSSAATSLFGQGVVFNVQVGPAPPPGVAGPAAQVEFFEGTTDLGGVAIAAGKPVFTLATLAPGSHTIVAVFNGDTNYYLVRSAPVALNVTRAQTATTLAATSSSAQVILTAAVSPTPPGSGIPGGTVQFIDATANTVLGSGGLPAGATSGAGSLSAGIAVTAAQIAAAAGHSITAIYAGDSNFASSISNGIAVPGLINATGSASQGFAPEELVSLFGSSLANTTLQNNSVPLPTSLGGYSITVTDAAGTVRSAGLYLVSPGQINFVIPAGTTGPAVVTLVNAAAPAGPGVIPIPISVVSVAPGIFSAGGNGSGLAAAQIVRVHPDGTQSLENVTAAPISFGTDVLYLVLYASGVRNAPLASVTCVIHSAGLPVTYAGPQGQYPGLDQVDVLLPPSLAGAGQVNVSLQVAGQPSNIVTLTFQ